VKHIRILIAVAAACLVTAAFAHPATQIEFNTLVKPPANSALVKAGCGLCHVGTATKLNPYGKDMSAAMKKLKTTKLTAAVMAKIAKLDSDKDKATNEKEIKAGTLPGDPKSKPAK